MSTLKISDVVWLVVTRRGNVFAAGPDANTSISNAVKKHTLSPSKGGEVISHYWESMIKEGYKCISVPINVELTDEEISDQHDRATQALQPQMHYDP